MTPMQVIHRVTISTTPQIRKELAALGLAVGEGFVTFEVDESNPAWSEISTWISRSGAVHVVSTKFTTTEMNAASWFALAPTWHCGYPQPEDEYLEVTYDLSAYCPSCGIGAVQRAPFRMKGEPRWGRNEILQLNWVFGEYFAKPALSTRVFQRIGVPSRGVLDADGANTLSSVQLVVANEVDVETAGLPFETCSRCHRPKFHPHARGFFPGVAGEDGERVARTKQWFGSGASAYQVVLATRVVVRELKGVRGVTFKPSANSAGR